MSQRTTSQPRATERFSKSLGGSMKSLVGTKGRTYFLLEHKTNSKKFKLGQTTEFIGDYVEIGRGNSYAISFGDDCNTVSRPHAAIIRKGNNWILKHLSKTNPTLINGNSVKNEWHLSNGDEIQFSVEGPKVAFLIPNNNNVNTMGMTIRLKAVMNEAVKPYKTAIALMTLVFILSVTGLGYFIYKNMQDMKYSKALSEAEIAELKQKIKSDSLNMVKLIAKKIQREPIKPFTGYNEPDKFYDNPDESAPKTLSELYPNVYFILSSKIVYKIKDVEKEVDFPASGTGFLLNDGRFVTARHVVEPWSFVNFDESDDKSQLLLNLIANNGGEVILYLTAYSPEGKTITFKSTDFVVDRSNDISKKSTDEDGNSFILSKASLSDGLDWAVTKTNSRGQLKYDKNLSNSLEASTTLYVLGYPFAKGVSKNGIKPGYGECKVSISGLDNGVIDVSGRSFDQGNSGGPVFTKVNEQYVVVGIVSAYQGNQGTIVPISSIR